MDRSTLQNRTIGIYLHLPFCRRRCNYCAFAISTSTELEEEYVSRLVGEIEELSNGEKVSTLYFGGGTPSLSSADSLARIRSTLESAFDLGELEETTLEVNPEDVDPDSVSAWRSLGFDRYSLGVQSYDPRELEAATRLHEPRVAIDALELLQGTGARVSVDLIAGLPFQSDDSFADSVERVLASEVGHVSVYMLDLEPGSPLGAQVATDRVTLPDESLVTLRYRHVVETFAANGLEQYEVSNFARPGEESRHNLTYWNRSPYLGFGLGAHSFDGSSRWANTRNMRHYLSASDAEHRIEMRELLTEEEHLHETLMLGLRQTGGFSRVRFAKLTGEKGELWRRRGVDAGWVRSDRVAFTTEGFVLSNELISELF